MDKHPADDEVVFIDGVGAARSSVKSCRDGVQWIRVGDRVYWPLSDSDAKRLHSACCGNGTFDGPATPVDVRNVILDALNRVHAEGWAGIESAMDEMADRLTALAKQPAAGDGAVCPNCERLTEIRHCQACGCDFIAAQHQEPTTCKHDFRRDEDHGGACCQLCGEVRQ